MSLHQLAEDGVSASVQPVSEDVAGRFQDLGCLLDLLIQVREGLEYAFEQLRRMAAYRLEELHDSGFDLGQELICWRPVRGVDRVEFLRVVEQVPSDYVIQTVVAERVEEASFASLYEER